MISKILVAILFLISNAHSMDFSKNIREEKNKAMSSDNINDCHYHAKRALNFLKNNIEGNTEAEKSFEKSLYSSSLQDCINQLKKIDNLL
jgi:hypothetical protein